MNSLYLFVSLEESAVKIGVSRDPERRALQLPNLVDLGRSFEVFFRDGSAFEVERLLHYCFRRGRKYMPYGDGCTEWFDLDLLPEILLFLEAQRPRLGINEIRPLSTELFSEREFGKATKAEEKAHKLEAKQVKQNARAASHAAALVNAAEHNAATLAWVRTKFMDLQLTSHLAGMLPTSHRADRTDWHLYLSGMGSAAVAEALTNGAPTVICPGGWSRVFCGCYGLMSGKVEWLASGFLVSSSQRLYRTSTKRVILVLMRFVNTCSIPCRALHCQLKRS